MHRFIIPADSLHDVSGCVSLLPFFCVFVALQIRDTTLNDLRHVVMQSIKFIDTVQTTDTELNFGQKFIASAPAFGEEPPVQFIMKHGREQVKGAIEFASESKHFISLSEAVAAIDRSCVEAAEAWKLVGQLAEKFAQTKALFLKRSQILFQQSRSYSRWIDKLLTNNRHAKDVLRIVPSVGVRHAANLSTQAQLEQRISTVDE